MMQHNEKPTLAAKNLGAAFIGCGLIFKTFTKDLLIKATGLALPFKNPLEKKSIVKRKTIHCLPPGWAAWMLQKEKRF